MAPPPPAAPVKRGTAGGQWSIPLPSVPQGVSYKSGQTWTVGKLTFRADFDSANLRSVAAGSNPNVRNESNNNSATPGHSPSAL